MSPSFRVGLVGFGNIGTGLVSHIVKFGGLVAERAGTPIELVAIADKDLTTPRDVTPPAAVRMVDDWKVLTADDSIDAVVELVGVGRDGKPTLAREIAVAALSSGKHFVTANKGLIAAHGAELHELAKKNNVLCLYEASVGAGIPIIATMQTTLAPNRLTGIHGMVNGTCNYILTQMGMDSSLTMERAIADAQAKGYAEPDPLFDVGGHDTAYKIVILASLAFGQELRFADVRMEGITELGTHEMRYARENGLALKLLASARLDGEGAASLIVGPHFLPGTHVLAGVNGVMNGVLVHGEPIGDTMYYGAGAGRPSTASGLMADLMLAARTQAAGSPNPFPLSIPKGGAKLQDTSRTIGRHYVRCTANDLDLAKRTVREAVSCDLLHTEGDEVIFITNAISEAAFDKLLGKIASAGVFTSRVTHVRFAFE